MRSILLPTKDGTIRLLVERCEKLDEIRMKSIFCIKKNKLFLNNFDWNRFAASKGNGSEIKAIFENARRVDGWRQEQIKLIGNEPKSNFDKDFILDLRRKSLSQPEFDKLYFGNWDK